MELHQLTDAELDAVNGGYVFNSWNFQQNNAYQVAQNNQVGFVNVPIYSSQTNVQVVEQENSIGG